MAQSSSPHEDLYGKNANLKIKVLAEAAGTCFLTTSVGANAKSRPMALQKVEIDGSLWFLSAVDSHKNKEIQQDSKVELYFMNNSSYEYLYIKGNARIHTDQALKDKYWNNFANAWFNGKEDPNLSVIEVIPDNGYYYETKDNKLVAMSKMLFSAITGKSVEDGGVEGEIKV
jgi:general stress protein 26